MLYAEDISVYSDMMHGLPSSQGVGKRVVTIERDANYKTIWCENTDLRNRAKLRLASF